MKSSALLNERRFEPFQSDIPVRLDRLPWARFHWLVVLSLGASWAIDGLEVTLAGAISGVLQERATLALSSAQIGATASCYLLGAVTGALLCGHLTDRHGRAMLFFVTLAIYLAGTLLSALSWNFESYAVFRFVTGFGIGGEYAAINSAIDELIPARVRGRVNLLINGSFWIGAVAGSGATVVLLDPAILPADVGWRCGFAIGVVLGLIVLVARRHVPESPRWLSVHGYRARAERVMTEIEARIAAMAGGVPPSPHETITIRPREKTELSVVFKTMFTRYRRRSLLGFVLIASQAFLYNAIFFTYALVLRTFYDVPAQHTGLYLMPFAVANFLGPLLLGQWFDTIGRRTMIAATYSLSGVLLLATGGLFANGVLSAYEQTALWAAIFFFASAAASSAYLTVSEIFPLELRAVAIAIFFAVGTGMGGVLAPWIFGVLIGSGSRMSLFWGYAFGSLFMLVAAGVTLKLGVNAERVSLEGVATPLSAEGHTR